MAANSRTFSSELLAPVAREAWKAIFEFARARKPPSCEGANIATQLNLIAGALKPRSLYQLPPEVQELCFLVLQDLFDICTVCFSILVPKIPRRVQHIVFLPNPIKDQHWSCEYTSTLFTIVSTPFSTIPLPQSFPFCAVKIRNSLYITFLYLLWLYQILVRAELDHFCSPPRVVAILQLHLNTLFVIQS